MAITIVQSSTSSVVGVGSISVGFGSPPTLGNYLIVLVVYRNNGAFSGVSDTGGINNYVADSSAINFTGGPPYISAYILSARVVDAPAIYTATALFVASTDASMAVLEVSGLENGTCLDQINSNTGNSGAPTAGAITTTRPNEIIFCLEINTQNTAVNPPTNFTAILNHQSSNDGCEMAYRIVSAIQAGLNVTWTTGLRQYAAAVASYMAPQIGPGVSLVAAQQIAPPRQDPGFVWSRASRSPLAVPPFDEPPFPFMALQVEPPRPHPGDVISRIGKPPAVPRFARARPQQYAAQVEPPRPYPGQASYFVSPARWSDVPPTPTSLAAVSTVYGLTTQICIALAWAQSQDTTLTQVWRSTDGISFSQVASAPGGVQVYTDTNVLANTTYYYYVVSSNTYGDSAASNVASASTQTTGLILKIARGAFAGLPTLDIGELALETNNSNVLIGTASGNVLVGGTPSGPYASRPAAGIRGRRYLPTDAPFLSIDDGAAWDNFGPLLALNEPKQYSWSWVNQDTATVDDSKGVIFLENTTSNGNLQGLNLRVKSAPAVLPYTIVTAILPLFPLAITAGVGVCFRENSSGKLLAVELFMNTYFPGITVIRCTSPTAVAATVVAEYPAYWTSFSGCWLVRLIYTGTNVTISLGSDGYNWRQIYTEAKTASFTTAPDQVGFYVNPYNQAAAMTLLSWKETY